MMHVLLIITSWVVLHVFQRNESASLQTQRSVNWTPKLIQQKTNRCKSRTDGNQVSSFSHTADG